MKREGCLWKGNGMKIIIIQGMTCLGKSTLCKQLEHRHNGYMQELFAEMLNGVDELVY